MDNSLQMITISYKDKRIQIFWDGLLIKEAASFLFKRALKEKPCFSNRQELHSWVQEVEKKSAQSYALFLLARRSYYSEALKEKLRSQGISLPIITNLLEEMKSLGYLQDEEYLIAWVKAEIRKGRSVLMIRAKAKQKGFHSHTISELLEKLFPVNLQSETAILQIKKLQKRGYPKEKIMQSLQRKGFSYGMLLDLLGKSI